MRRFLVGAVFVSASILSIIQIQQKSGVSEATESQLIECLGYNKPACQDSWVLSKVKLEGPREAVKSVGGSKSPVVAASCHALMHKIGITSHDTYKQYDIKTLLLQADSDCQFGYQHGVFIAASNDITQDEVFVNTVYEACSAYEGNEYNRTSCRHGIGHAATIRKNGDVVAASNTLCSIMSSDADHCVTGAVMEWVSTYARNQVLERPELENVCGDILSSLQKSCWREIPGLWRMQGEAGSVSLQRCAKLGEENKEYCSRGVGFRSQVDADCQGPDFLTTGVCMGGRAIMYYEMQHKMDPSAAEKVCPTVQDVQAREICSKELQYTIDAYESIGV